MSSRPTDPPDVDGVDEEVFDLDLDEISPDTDSVMKEAVRAVEEIQSRPDDEEDPVNVGEGELTPGDSDALQVELAELKERNLRVLADYENFRKRSEREREETKRYALTEPMRQFLEVIDNLERAVHAEGSSDDLKTGVEMILRQMHALVARLGVERVGAEGEVFDPAVHEAVSSVEGDVEQPMVVDELQSGYMLYDRLLRPSMVRVVVPGSESSEADGDESVDSDQSNDETEDA